MKAYWKKASTCRGRETWHFLRTENMQKASWLDTLLRDVRCALRQFARNSLFTIVAMISLAIGIGADTAIFSVMDAVLLRSLAVPNPQELVMFTDPNASGVTTGLNTGEICSRKSPCG